ncbi:MAG: DMT family transporter [Gemmobacter sp.]|nr:DMT family transporter [Gemmobacter sp.]
MTAPPRPVLVAVLLAIGIGWGSTQPLGKMSVATGHPPFGVIFWQLVIGTVLLGAISLARRRPLVLTRRRLEFFVVVAILGTLVPNTTFYISVARLPSGIMSILISAVPLIALPLALALGNDRFSWARLGGLLLGLAGVGLIALPGSSLPDPAMAAFLPLALVGPLFYALEGNYVAWRGTDAMDPVQAMAGASFVGMVLIVPLVLVTGQWVNPFAAPGQAEFAMLLMGIVHGLVYAAFVWLVAVGGPVFAGQSAYLVTASGMVWAMVLLDERFSPTVWAAMATMLAGVALVRPRDKETLVRLQKTRQELPR